MARIVAAITAGLMAGALAACTTTPALPGPPPGGKTPAFADIIANAPDGDWRPLDPARTLYMDLARGRVVIELAPEFAPSHVANITALSREGYFRGGGVTRVQDNFVAQWSQASDPPRKPVQGKETLKAEFTLPRSAPIAFQRHPDPDTFAPEVGFWNGFAVARDARSQWLTHCYGVVGVGREDDPDSGGGGELYAIIGHAPRGLDRNLTVVGRVVQGMELLSSLPRGTEALGFYKTPAEYARFSDIRLAADAPPAERTNLEVMRTDSASFATLVNARRWRNDDFYRVPPGRIGLCNIAVPVRAAKAG
jgi:peptidylprolyl isomerase